MDGRHVFGVLRQPGLDVLAKGPDEGESRRVVIIERVMLDPSVKLFLVVDFLRAEIVNLVMILVFLVQEFLHLVEAVPVDGLQIFGRESHRDDSVADVAEVEVVSIFDVAQLLLAHQRLEGAGHSGVKVEDSNLGDKNRNLRLANKF